MKKIFLVLLSLTFTLHLSAQQMGVKAGINYATVVGDDADDSDYILAPVFGLSSSTELNFGILKGEILYSQKGASFEDEILGIDIKQTMTFNYLEFASAMVFNVAEQVNLHGGIYSGYLLSGQMTIEIDGDKDSESFDDLDELDSRWDLGLNIGGAYVLNDQMQVDLSYRMGLVDFMNVDPVEVEAKHSSLQLGVIYSF